MSKVILLFGPSGSGKTELARRIAKNHRWKLISEDDFWHKLKNGNSSGELRTPAEQEIIFSQVIDLLTHYVSKNKNVILEFILYEEPPRPVMKYTDALNALEIKPVLKALRPTVEEIIIRQSKRGRTNDSDSERAIRNAKLQLSALSFLDEENIIDNTNDSVDETYKKYFREIVKH